MIPLAWRRPRATLEELEAARRMTFEEKLLAGGRLFDQECEIIRRRIRQLMPDASEELQHDLLLLAIKRVHGGE
jgi:hypothetical protein